MERTQGRETDTYLSLGHDVDVRLGAVEVHVARDSRIRVDRHRLVLVR